MSTIAPRDQFKPIRIGENLVVNYKNEYWIVQLKGSNLEIFYDCFYVVRGNRFRSSPWFFIG